MGNISLLVLEDVDVVRRHIVSILADLNIQQIVEANSAQDAVLAVEHHHPNVAILDVQVPGTEVYKTGLDVLRWIHQNHPETAVIMISNYDFPQYRHAAMTLGAQHFFDKSHEFQKLHDAVEALLLNRPSLGGR